MVPPGNDASASNVAALAAARLHPDRLAVMAPLDLKNPANAGAVAAWRSEPLMLGIRLAFLRDPNLSLLIGGRLGWLWSAAEDANVPITLLAPGLERHVDAVAAAHPALRLVIDHCNLDPRVAYPDLAAAVEPLLTLARRPNVAIKASALACWTSDTFPFPSLHAAVGRVVGAFGAQRVFWGSDLTRLPCPYSEYLRLFTEELPFLTASDRDWVMGRGLLEWLRWDEAAGRR
jgi:predicted TIM-barrel fold metal-dependent hydrolase